MQPVWNTLYADNSFFSLMNWIYLFGPFPRGLFSETFHIETASRQPIFGYYLNFEDKLAWVQYL